MDICSAPLLLRSNYSLLRGTASVERLVGRAAECGFSSVALTDRNNLYGAIPFYRKARQAGLKPVLGAEMVAGSRRAVVLARNVDGYANLCRLLSRRNLRDDFSLPRQLARCREGLHILTDDTDLAGELSGRVAAGRLWLLLRHPAGRPGEWSRIREASRALNVPLAAMQDVYFLDSEEYEVHRTLSAARENTMVSRLDEAHVAPPDAFFPAPGRVKEIFRDHPQALTNAVSVLEDCDLELPLGRPIFPPCSVPDGETPFSYLHRLCRRGLGRRYDPVTEDARNRLERELRVIEDLGYTEYFIVAWDILEYARREGIPTIGRGSGASSIVSYALGITQADPLKYDIPFERFLHRRREDPPDLDVDLCWRKRDRLIESIYRRYGSEKVAMVSTLNTFRLRSAFRDVARARGMPQDEVDRVSRKLPHSSADTVAHTLASSGADRRCSCGDEELSTIARLAERIRGFPRHTGIHCGGLVIGERPLEEYVPLERASKGIVVTQFDKDAVEERGLIKMDFLGNHGLTIRDEAMEMVDGDLAPGDIPDDDPQTARVLGRAGTVSCCQLESPVMRNLLSMLQPGSIRGLMQALALVRPAPASCGMKEEFVLRTQGEKEVAFEHPLLKGVLGDTRGILLFEDDAMRVASALAGVSLEEGDLLRRAISKGESEEELRRVSHRFIRRAVQNGVSRETASRVWARMSQFNRYSFCRAHAASYAIMAYQLAYLKGHHPAEFMTAVLNHHWGMYPRRVHLEEARRAGVDILGLHINRSEEHFSLEDGGIRVGLGQVKQLTEETLQRTLRLREREPFRSVPDFLRRTGADRREAENLVLAGAFDHTGLNRPQLLWQLTTTGADGAETGSGTGLLFPNRGEEPEPPALAGYSRVRRMKYEMSVLELSVAAHPMQVLRPKLEGPPLPRSDALPELVGRKVCTAGILSATRKTTTRSGDPMQFLTLEDARGLFEVTLFPGSFRDNARHIEGLGPYVVTGTVEDQHGAITLNAASVRPMERPGSDSRKQA